MQSAPTKEAEPSDVAKKGPPRPTGPRQPWWTGVMDRRFVKSFEPLATYTKSLVNAGGMKLHCCCYRCISAKAYQVFLNMAFTTGLQWQHNLADDLLANMHVWSTIDCTILVVSLQSCRVIYLLGKHCHRMHLAYAVSRFDY